MTAVPKEFAWVFWDRETDVLDVERDAHFILPRILEFATLAEVKWTIATYGMDRIHDFLRNVGHPELSERTLAFWRAVFKAENEQWAASPSWRKSSSAPWID